MDEEENNNVEILEEMRRELDTTKDEVQNLTKQLNCLLLLTKSAWKGDETAATHLARVIGKQKLANAFIQPYLQVHIDPIPLKASRQLYNEIVHRQNQLKPNVPRPIRPQSSSVRPRAIKHLYRPASADKIVHHLGTPSSRAAPYFVFAGQEYFRKSNDSPSQLLRRTNHASANGIHSTNRGITSRHSNHSSLSETSDATDFVETPKEQQQQQQVSDGTPLNLNNQRRPLTAATNRRRYNHVPPPSRNRVQSATAYSEFIIKQPLIIDAEKARREAFKMQRELNLPRQGWINMKT
ncbi:unnamed protein product [Didymodactylos carnosus]|uniref:Uncharacterized protein n=1 Tax=Didymodactylos carnosus TaxID=1234261 RepID=A0A813R4L4_9BILA|nr:unnamed protein product [Didymodactylos carnosus]CAF3558577.1 unnamed protein product [Didymodactylos carnosus]